MMNKHKLAKIFIKTKKKKYIIEERRKGMVSAENVMTENENNSGYFCLGTFPSLLSFTILQSKLLPKAVF